MKKLISILFWPLGMLFIIVSFTGANFSDSVATPGNTLSAGVSSHSDIVLNEAMVNPAIEDGNNPNGEWIEIYNKGNWTLDVSGWYIYDSTVSNNIVITAADTNTGLTQIPAGGYLAIYKNGVAIFNNGGDSVRLFDGPISTGTLIDSMIYSSSTDSKTWDRLPNGIGGWSDGHIPTPGGPNV